MENFIKVVLGANSDCNISELDGEPCQLCHEIPIIKTTEKILKSGKKLIKKDRSSRVDCESDTGAFSLVTFHVQCWYQAINLNTI